MPYWISGLTYSEHGSHLAESSQSFVARLNPCNAFKASKNIKKINQIRQWTNLPKSSQVHFPWFPLHALFPLALSSFWFGAGGAFRVVPVYLCRP